MRGAVLRPLELSEGVRRDPVGALRDLEGAGHLELLDRARVARLARALEPALVDRARHVEAAGLGRRQLGLCAEKIMAKLSLLHYLKAELSLTTSALGSLVSAYPPLLGLSLAANVRPTIEYMRSLGVPITKAVKRHPQLLGLSIDANLRPTAEYLARRRAIRQRLLRDATAEREPLRHYRVDRGGSSDAAARPLSDEPSSPPPSATAGHTPDGAEGNHEIVSPPIDGVRGLVQYRST